MAALGILTALVFIVGLGIVLFSIDAIIRRRRAPGFSTRGIAGIGFLIVGFLALALCVAFFIGVLFDGDVVILEEHTGPNGGNSSSYSGPGDLLGPGGLSVWLLLAGATIGAGVFLNTKRFSLRSLVIALGLLAFLASIPHLLIPQKGRQAIISVELERRLSTEEWSALESTLSKDRLCATVSTSLRKSLPCPVANGLMQVDVEPVADKDLERNGTTGVRLTLRFSGELERRQIEALFAEMNRHVIRAVQSASRSIGPTGPQASPPDP